MKTRFKYTNKEVVEVVGATNPLEAIKAATEFLERESLKDPEVNYMIAETEQPELVDQRTDNYYAFYVYRFI